MRISFAGISDVGRVRQENQDALAMPSLEGQAGGWLFVLADGMGGVAGGAQASGIAVSVVPREFHRALAAAGVEQPAERAPLLRAAVESANREIREQAAADASLTGMGTTLVAVALRRGRALIANVGDSRAYLLRAGELRQLSEDHSLVQQEVAMGALTAEEARNHAMKNILTRALGAEDQVEVDLFPHELKNGDVLLLCSDGLHGPVPDASIKELLGAASQPQDAAERLIEAANHQGGPDNVSVVVVRVDELDSSEQEPGTDTQSRNLEQGPGGLRGLLRRVFS